MTSNEIWAEIQRLGPQERTARGIIADSDERWTFIEKFGYAVPSKEAIVAIRDFVGSGVLLDVGTGAALWPRLLVAEGVRVIPTDPNVDGLRVCRSMSYRALRRAAPFMSVEKLRADEAMAKYPPDVLMMVWPGYNETWPVEALKLFQGQKFVYIGEDAGGCTADDAFHEYVRQHFDVHAAVALPKWFAIHDRLVLYVRKETL